MADVRLEGVNKAYGAVEVLRNIDLTIDHGEFVVFVGPSGSGKSTLLRMIGGLERISGGRLLIDNEVVNNVDAADRNLGMVFQSYALYPHMTVRQNLAFPLRMAKVGEPRYTVGSLKLRPCCRWIIYWIVNLDNSQAGTGSAWRLVGRLCANPRSSCSTSHCRTWIRNYGCRCGFRLPSFTSSLETP